MPLSLIFTAIVPNEPVEEVVMTPRQDDLDAIRELIGQGDFDNLLRDPTYLGGTIARLDAKGLSEAITPAAVEPLSCPSCRNGLQAIASLAQDRRAIVLCRYEVPVRKFHRKGMAA